MRTIPKIKKEYHKNNRLQRRLKGKKYMKIKRITSVLAAAIIAIAMIAPNACADKWVKTDSGYKYEYDNGSYAKTGWLKIDGKTYYIKKDGTRQTGWLKTKTAKYYFDKNGVMYKSKWLTLKNGSKYYMQSNGKAATGVVKADDVTYKFASDGKCLGVNYRFILNKDTLCLHSSDKCRAAEKIDDENYKIINIGADEIADYAENGYWCCGVNGCNDKVLRKLLPKPKK